VRVLHTRCRSDGGEIGAEEGERERKKKGGKKKGKPQDIRGAGGQSKAGGETWGLCFLGRVAEQSMC